VSLLITFEPIGRFSLNLVGKFNNFKTVKAQTSEVDSLPAPFRLV
jgi:hypothetical protein